MKETVTHVDLRSARDLRGPVLGLLLLRTGERTALLIGRSTRSGPTLRVT